MIHSFKLDNGLRVVFEKIDYVKSVSIGLWVNAGSTYENNENNGVSHFIEHMLFKGTKNRAAFQIAEEIEGIGGQINAFTSKESTCFYTKVTAEKFEVSIDILSDMIFNSTISEDAIEKEKKVIEEEIKMYDDSPEEYAHDLLSKIAFEEKPLSMPILGTKKSLENIDRRVIKDYMEKRYTGPNTVISIVGNVEPEFVEKTVRRYFDSFSSDNNHKDSGIKYNFTRRIKGVNKDIEQLHFCLGTEGFERDNKNYYTLNILNNILGGSMSSRLFQNIREKQGLVYSIYSFNSCYKETGLFGIYSAINTDSVEKSTDLIKKEINKVKKGDIRKEEFDRAKSQMKGNYILSLENTSSRMTILGRRELLYNETITPESIINKIENVKYEDVMNSINYIFDSTKYNIAYIGNLEKHKYIEEILNNF
ncbi:MAG TPA: peptidase M16 [Clostridiales bacterium]|jgi:predicted Zn-dependent peptidase|nr:peptidase M16 [Clostridiales bacterium]